MFDCNPTQPIVDMSICENEVNNDSAVEEDESIWGRLFPIGKGFEQIDLDKDEISCGRKPDCDIKLTKNNRFVNVNAYSNLHFTIKREDVDNDECFPLIYDHSSNGTFINGTKIGKGKCEVIKNFDEIALSKPENKAFIFKDKSTEINKYPAKICEKYTILKQLGVGAYGEVRLAFSKDTREKYAVKIISKKKFTMNGRNTATLTPQIMSEVEILKRLNHPCIIKIIEVIETPETVFIVLELVSGGELFDKVVKLGQYDEKTARLLFYQMLVSIKYLHDSGITHRDLKPENILLSGESKETLIKITDFGLSKFFDSTTVMKTFCGTPNYLAPEVLVTRGEGSYTNKVDNWSLGVILYIMLVGYPPFNDENKKVPLDQQIKKGIYDFPDEYWKDISKDAIDLIKKLLTVDPNKRYTIDQCLNHPWIKCDQKTISLAEKLMNLGKNGTYDSFYINSSTSGSSTNLDDNTTNTNNDDGRKKRALRDDSPSPTSDNSNDTNNNKKRLKANDSNSTDKSTEILNA